MVDYQMIGKRIREYRMRRGLTQTALAERAGVEPTNVSHIERAATKVSLPTLLRIANALDASLDELVYGNLKRSAHISEGIIAELLSDCTPEELLALAGILRAAKEAVRGIKK